MRLLFICHGNICRSPMAEMVLKALLRERGAQDEITVESAAVSAEELGNDVYPPARRELARHGVPCETRRAWKIRREDYDRYDLILAMDRENAQRAYLIFGGDPEKKIQLLMSYTSRGGEVADPWYTDRFDVAYREIREGCEGLLRALLMEK